MGGATARNLPGASSCSPTALWWLGDPEDSCSPHPSPYATRRRARVQAIKTTRPSLCRPPAQHSTWHTLMPGPLTPQRAGSLPSRAGPLHSWASGRGLHLHSTCLPRASPTLSGTPRPSPWGHTESRTLEPVSSVTPGGARPRVPGRHRDWLLSQQPGEMLVTSDL